MGAVWPKILPNLCEGVEDKSPLAVRQVHTLQFFISLFCLSRDSRCECLFRKRGKEQKKLDCGTWPETMARTGPFKQPVEGGGSSRTIKVKRKAWPYWRFSPPRSTFRNRLWFLWSLAMTCTVDSSLCGNSAWHRSCSYGLCYPDQPFVWSLLLFPVGNWAPGIRGWLPSSIQRSGKRTRSEMKGKRN